MAQAAPSILLVDDHAVIAAPLAMALQASGFGTVAAADPEDLSTAAVVQQAQRIGADLVLLDLHLGRGRIGVPMVEPLRRTGAKVLLFTAAADPDLIAGGLKAGAEAVVDKAMPFQGLVGALHAVARGEQLMADDERAALIEALDRREGEQDERLRPFRSLTEREEAVLRDLVDGRSPKEIARADGVSVSTVRGHIGSVLGKLGVNSQREALALARAAGWPRP